MYSLKNPVFSKCFFLKIFKVILQVKFNKILIEILYLVIFKTPATLYIIRLVERNEPVHKIELKKYLFTEDTRCFH